MHPDTEGDRSPQSDAQATRVSVVMPVRDGAASLQAAINSVLADLTWRDELIVVDDGSTDSTAEIALSYGDNVRVVLSAGDGIVDALNTGLRESHGTYIARCDADDLWLPGHIETLLPLLEANPQASAAFGSAILENRSGRTTGRSTPPPSGDPLKLALLRHNPLIHGAVLARRSSLVGVGAYRHVDSAEDYDLWLRLIRTSQIVTSSTPIYVYRLSDGGVHRKKRRRQARSTVRLLLEHGARTGRLSAWGLLRNAASSVWVGPRSWKAKR